MIKQNKQKPWLERFWVMLKHQPFAKNEILTSKVSFLPIGNCHVIDD